MTEAIFFFKSLTPLGWAVLTSIAGAAFVIGYALAML